jgi:hypothetical protein
MNNPDNTGAFVSHQWLTMCFHTSEQGTKGSGCLPWSRKKDADKSEATESTKSTSEKTEPPQMPKKPFSKKEPPQMPKKPFSTTASVAFVHMSSAPSAYETPRSPTNMSYASLQLVQPVAGASPPLSPHAQMLRQSLVMPQPLPPSLPRQPPSPPSLHRHDTQRRPPVPPLPPQLPPSFGSPPPILQLQFSSAPRHVYIPMPTPPQAPRAGGSATLQQVSPPPAAYPAPVPTFVSHAAPAPGAISPNVTVVHQVRLWFVFVRLSISSLSLNLLGYTCFVCMYAYMNQLHVSDVSVLYVCIYTCMHACLA